MSNAIARTLFAVRNGDKAAHQDYMRGYISAGQAAGVVKETAAHNNALGKEAQKVVSVFDKAAENSKFMTGLGKAVNFATKNVNNLIALSAGIKVLKADNKEDAFLTQGSCLAGMFICEGWMNKNLSRLVKQGAEALSKTAKFAGNPAKLKALGKWAPIVEGVAFVIGSVGGSMLFMKGGEKISHALHFDKSKEEKFLERYAAKYGQYAYAAPAQMQSFKA